LHAGEAIDLETPVRTRFAQLNKAFGLVLRKAYNDSLGVIARPGLPALDNLRDISAIDA
jgi:hypothetical protein